MKAPRLTAAWLLALMMAGAADAAPRKKPATPPAEAKSATAVDEGEKPISGEVGTTIVGEQESPIGLYITPWKDEYAERGLDRPARFLDEELQPIDRATFYRQVEYFNKIDAYRKSKLAAEQAPGATPAAAPPSSPAP